MKLGRFGYLDHNAEMALVRPEQRPHRERPIERMNMLLSGMDIGQSCLGDPVKQYHAFVRAGSNAGERRAD
jgi:hypothetical protein